MNRSYTGRVAALEFSDGIQRPCADCEGDCCGCCEDAHHIRPEGTYITVRLDSNPAVSGGRVTVTYEED